VATAPPDAPGPRSAGCAASPPPGGPATLLVNGNERAFLVHAPARATPGVALPVLFAFHGAGSSGEEYAAAFPLAASFRERALLVFPTALRVTPDGPTTWRRDSDDDVAFVDALLAWLSERHCVDTSRVFAAGFSSGGYFTNTLGCRRGDVLRAIVPVAGGERDFDGRCRGAPAVFLVIGAQDTEVPFGGPPGLTNLDRARHARDHFVQASGCNGAPLPVEPAPCVAYQGCRPGAEVTYCEHPGGHTWPALYAEAAARFLDDL
jgi:polyhydroxybutyrate depolymerase